jgi:hypothetical protein
LPDIVAEVAAAFEGYEGAVVSQDVGMLEAGLRRCAVHLLISLASLENIRKTSRPGGKRIVPSGPPGRCPIPRFSQLEAEKP